MSSVPIRDRAMDEAVIVGRDRENVVVGNEIIRHRLLLARHPLVASPSRSSSCLLTGMPIWSPIFGGWRTLFGGLRSAAGSIPGPASRSRSRRS